jgi:protein DEK
MLHSLLFNKRGKAAVLKQRILQFSGYVWTENQEKERARVKEKLERYTKEGLVLLIDVLDLHLPRTGKKVKFLLVHNCVRLESQASRTIH